VTEIGEGPFHALNDNFVKILQIPEGIKDVEEVVEMISHLNIITSPTE
jgi:predicted Fe-Mo cluster-binding NifX family protein